MNSAFDVSIDIGKGQTLQCMIPSRTGASHVVEIPMTVDGLRVLHRILTARKGERNSTLGMEGSPTQAIIRKWLAENRATTNHTKKIGFEPDLSDVSI